jgi:hypothetical protein
MSIRFNFQDRKSNRYWIKGSKLGKEIEQLY